MTRGDSLFAAVLAVLLFAHLAQEVKATLPAALPDPKSPEAALPEQRPPATDDARDRA